jgi:hypothetical protein
MVVGAAGALLLAVWVIEVRLVMLWFSGKTVYHVEMACLLDCFSTRKQQMTNHTFSA